MDRRFAKPDSTERLRAELRAVIKEQQAILNSVSGHPDWFERQQAAQKLRAAKSQLNKTYIQTRGL